MGWGLTNMLETTFMDVHLEHDIIKLLRSSNHLAYRIRLLQIYNLSNAE